MMEGYFRNSVYRMLVEDPLETSIDPREIGRLDVMDELFNALHGVGDVDLEIKELVVLTVDDIQTGGGKAMTVKGDGQKQMLCEIYKTLAAALNNKPNTVKAVLERWLTELKTVQSVAEIVNPSNGVPDRSQ